MKFVLVLIFSLFSTVSQAMILENPKSIVIVEFQQQFYQLTLEETRNIDSIKPFENRLIKSENWSETIQKGKSELAIALLEKLYSYLPNNEFMPYLKLALNRNDDNLMKTVADKAYLLAENFLTPNALLKIRTNNQYRKNLTAQVYWISVFRNYGKKFESLDQAVSYLRQDSLIENKDRDSKKRSAMAVIAKSKDSQELMELMNDANFEIALSSWYGLSRLIPEKVAYEIVSEAIWRSDEINYRIQGGCIVLSKMLSPGMAAYDLFSDYLSQKQLKEIMAQDPLLSSQEFSKYSSMLVQSHKMADALNNLSITKKSIHSLDNFNLKKTIKYANKKELEDLFLGDDMGYATWDLEFTKNVSQYLIEKTKNNQENITYALIVSAFKSKNIYAKKYLEFLLSDEVTMNQQANNAEKLLGGYGNTGWPREWQDLRNKAIEIYQNNLYKDSDMSDLSADSQLLLNL